ncbi:ras GEF [Schizopora paradoxa]|uniref:Ras GEF n=1 Tax=Schizopora paradoxa TaxID=27342 RepID=A0A0H2S7N5_9AGAM|nr:ras GEF [Schizopora paradoxa]
MSMDSTATLTGRQTALPASTVPARDSEASSVLAATSSAAGSASPTIWPASPDTEASSRPLPPADSERLFSPRILKKSVSMDSLKVEDLAGKGMGEDDDELHVGASTDVEKRVPSKSSGSLSSPPSSLSLTAYIRSKTRSTRRRGASHSTTDNETSTQDESDFDRVRSSSSSNKTKGRVRQRLLSFRSAKSVAASISDHQHVPLPELHLSGRRPSASLTNLTLPDAAASANSAPPSAYHSPSQDVAKRVAETRPSGRSRSFSVGAQVSGPSKPTTSRVNKRRSLQENLRACSIAVIGVSGSGKSAFIRKSLKRHELSEAQSQSATVREGEQSKEIKYSRRVARYSQGTSTEVLLTVYEFSTEEWILEDGNLLSAWATGVPRVDGIFVCYDASELKSFNHVVDILVGYRALDIPAIVLACKSDLEIQILPVNALRIVQPYCNIIEATTKTEEGKSKMRRSIEVMVRLISESSGRKSETVPFSPSTPAEVTTTSSSITSADSSTPTPTSVPPLPKLDASPSSPAKNSSPTKSENSLPTIARMPPTPSSPTRVRSMNDILSRLGENSRAYDSDGGPNVGTKNIASTSARVSISDEALPVSVDPPIEPQDVPIITRTIKPPQPSPWVSLDELLEKLIFLATSGDDPAFIRHFFLTYRRFSTPRSVLLGMQKRMVELTIQGTTGDVILASYSQMRICNLLEHWISEYPSDFTVPGTQGALNAFIRNTLQHSHTLAYGSEFLPFLEQLPTLVDSDSTWAMKADFSESDESDSMFGDDTETEDTEMDSPLSMSPSRSEKSPASSPKSTMRERRTSLPLTAMSLIKTPYTLGTRALRSESTSSASDRDITTKLVKVSAGLQNFEADVIAQEITRQEMNLFLKIEPRHWLRHTLLPGKKDPSTDPIARFNSHYNDLHEWAVSLILCHDKMKARARQIEKFAEVAIRLRALNNYSGLRAIITAINQATFPGDPSMEIFKSKTELHKKYLSSDILLRTTGSHQSYRMALRNTKGPCIPSMEVHTSDLRRANEGNADVNPEDSTKINWAKYSMIGRFVDTTTQLQQRCRGPGGYKLVENSLLSSHFDITPMGYEMQQRRMPPPPNDDFDTTSYPSNPISHQAGHAKEASVIKRILAW